MNRIHGLLCISVVAVTLIGCAKKPPVTTAPVSNHAVEQKTSAPASPEIALSPESELESKRLLVEKLMNEIMEKEVYFAYDKFTLTSAAMEKLATVGNILASEPKLIVRIDGHTDLRGTEAYNMVLGSKRAKSVQEYLLRYGVPLNRISTRSFGEEFPKRNENTEEAYSQNRRAVFHVDIGG